ncbi:MAG: SDR family oxidoreductase [Porphyromonadaceae bacterium]|nr:SDR family oxidoreductase [Porphyromonadaceae bacterium]
MLNLENKKIVITGASSGIGRACAISLSMLKAKLILFGRNIERLEETKSELHGNEHLFYSQDVRDINNFSISINEAVTKLGPIDGFIYSAGIQHSSPLRKYNKEIFTEQFDVNTVSAFETARILTQKKNFNSDGGSIVFISSIKGVVGDSNILGYSASKGALISGARSLAIELSKKNIRVNTISPGMVEDTTMTVDAIKQFSNEWALKSKEEYPLGWISTSDVAYACLFLLSDLSKKITGTNLIVDGGFSAK